MLDKLRDRYKNFKVTMFMVTWDLRFELEKGGMAINQERFIPFVNAVRHAVDEGWMEIAIHGLTHVDREFADITPKAAVSRVKFAENFLKDTKIPYVKIFKAPQWLISKESKAAIEKEGFKVVEDGYYNWNIKDNFPVEKDNIIAHGHIQNVCNNGLEESFMRLLEIPSEYEWKFISEVI